MDDLFEKLRAETPVNKNIRPPKLDPGYNSVNVCQEVEKEKEKKNMKIDNEKKDARSKSKKTKATNVKKQHIKEKEDTKKTTMKIPETRNCVVRLVRCKIDTNDIDEKQKKSTNSKEKLRNKSRKNTSNLISSEDDDDDNKVEEEKKCTNSKEKLRKNKSRKNTSNLISSEDDDDDDNKVVEEKKNIRKREADSKIKPPQNKKKIKIELEKKQVIEERKKKDTPKNNSNKINIKLSPSNKKNNKQTKKTNNNKVISKNLYQDKMAMYKEKYGERIFQLKVRIKRCKDMSTPKRLQKNKKKLSVSFLEEVKVISNENNTVVEPILNDDKPEVLITENEESCVIETTTVEPKIKITDDDNQTVNTDDNELITLKVDENSSNIASLEDISSDELPSSESNHVNGFEESAAEIIDDKPIEAFEEQIEEELLTNIANDNNTSEDVADDEDESFKSASLGENDDKLVDESFNLTKISEQQEDVAHDDIEMESLVELNLENNADNDTDANDDEVASKLLMPEDVTGLLDVMETASEKLSPLEVDKLNATIALIDDSNPAAAELNLDDGSLGVDRTEADSIVDSIVNSTMH